MKIHCSKADLSRGVQTIQSALSSRTPLPNLLNFLIETEDSKLKLVSTDLEMGVKHYIPAEIETGGSITIPAKKFSDIIHTLQDEHDIDLTVEPGGKVQLKSGRSRFSIIGAPKSEYPVLPEFNQTGSFSIKATTLEEMVRKTLIAASSDESRHALNGCFWVGHEGNLEMVATDGRRLAIIKRACLPKDKEFRVIVPTKILTELLRLLSQEKAGEEDQVQAGVTDNQIAFQYKTTTLLSRLVEGSFPNYEQVIPVKKDLQVQLDTKAFVQITKRASLCASDRGGSVKFTLRSGALHVYASSPNLEFDDELAVDYKGAEFAVAFNPQFILDGLKAFDCDKVMLSLTAPVNPALFEPLGETDYKYVVMPMRV